MVTTAKDLLNAILSALLHKIFIPILIFNSSGFSSMFLIKYENLSARFE